MKSKNWQSASGASANALEKLASIAPFSLPESYISFLSKSNGGQGPLHVQPCWLCLDSAEQVVETEQNGTFHEFFSGYFVIGSNGAGEAVAFRWDGESEPHVVHFDMANIDTSESVQYLASSFDGLVELMGPNGKAAAGG